jgi:hypothetical protein
MSPITELKLGLPPLDTSSDAAVGQSFRNGVSYSVTKDHYLLWHEEAIGQDTASWAPNSRHVHRARQLDEVPSFRNVTSVAFLKPSVVITHC